MKKLRSRIIKALIAIVMCFFCAFSFVGCGMGGNPGKGTDRVPGGGTTGSTAPPLKEPSSPDISDVVGDGPSIEDYNEVFAGAIAVYEADRTDDIYYDKYQQKNMSFNELLDRQFTTMADYLYSTLNKIYGTTSASNVGGITGYKGTVNYNYVDTLTTSLQKKVSGLDDGTLANKETLSYKNAINGGYKIMAKLVTETDASTGEEVQSIQFDKYSDTELVADNAWKRASLFSKDYIKKCLVNIYISLGGISVDTDATFSYTSNNLLIRHYETYSPTYSIDNGYKEITKLGFSEDFLWHVAYFLAYDIIGKDNLEASINGAKDIFSGTTIKPLKVTDLTGIADLTNLTDIPAFNTYQNYKGYDAVIKDVVWNMAKLAVPSSGTVSFASSINYFNGSNSSTTMFPRLQLNEYVFYDDVDTICDVKPVPEPDPDEEYDPDAEEEPTLEGTPRKLKQLIYIPKVTMEDLEDGLFNVDTLFMGLKKNSGSDFMVKVTFDAVFDKSGKSASQKELVFSTDYKNVTQNKVVVSATYDDTEDTVDGAMFTDSELEKKEDYRFGDAVLKNGVSIDNLTSKSFNKESYTVKYSDNTTYTYDIGRMCVYNDLFDSEFNLNFSKNYLQFNFQYFDKGGAELSSVPSMYLMYFALESM